MLATGMANDAAGWLILGAIAGVATSGSVSAQALLVPLFGMGAFIVVAFTVGQRLVDQSLRLLRRFEGGVSGSLTVAVVVALAAGAATQWIGVEAVLGGFVAGILLGRSKFQRSETRPYLEGLTAAVFAPIFFATAGLRVDAQLLGDAHTLSWTAAVIGVGSATKFAGAYIGGRRADLPRREAAALGIGLNSRGTVEIVIATVGLALGVFNPTSYTVILTMVLVTSTLAPPILRLAVKNWPGTEEEQRRLERESALARNVLVKRERILLPSRGGVNSQLAARLISLAWPDDVEATILSVGTNGDRPNLDDVLAAMRGRPVELKRVSSDNPVDAVLRYAGLGYGVIGVGAVDRANDGQLLSPMVDELMARSPLPMVIVRHNHPRGDVPRSFRRILVPAVGTRAARAAQEVAFNVAAKLRTDTVLVHVATRLGAGESAAAVVASDTGEHPTIGGGPPPRRALRRLLRRATEDLPRSTGREPAAARVVREAQERASRLGVDASATIREGTSTPAEIVKTAKELGVDLVFLGVTIREVDGHPFMGHSVEQILDELDATVVIVTTPRND
jgi:nucleotide-binding universal stress UspA family protein